MSKFYGMVGYAIPRETTPGVFVNADIEERPYYGDQLRNVKKWDSGETLNDNLNIQDDVSIIADGFAYLNAQYIKYVIVSGVKWKVRSIKIERPRITLTLGEVYHD